MTNIVQLALLAVVIIPVAIHVWSVLKSAVTR
jgi:hypothetical protein